MRKKRLSLMIGFLASVATLGATLLAGPVNASEVEADKHGDPRYNDDGVLIGYYCWGTCDEEGETCCRVFPM